MMSTDRHEADLPESRRWFARASAGPAGPRWLHWVPFQVRVAVIVAAYMLVTIGVLGTLLLQLRADTLEAAGKLTRSLTRMAAHETSYALQSVQQTLIIADGILDRYHANGTLAQETVGAEFRALLRDRPYLLVMWLIDEQGRIVFHSKDDATGVDVSDRPYFLHHLERPGDPFHLADPVKSRITGAWLLPATRAWIGPDGRFRGVIVAAMNPAYFQQAWTPEDAGRDFVVSLRRADGTLLLRSPFRGDAFGRLLPAMADVAAAEERVGHGLSIRASPIDGIDRLFVTQRLPFNRDLIIVVGQGVNGILAPWRHIVGVVALGWIFATLGLAVLGTWLVGEWQARQATERNYRTLFEDNPDPMAVFDRETRRYLAVNDAMVRQYGWTREEFKKMTPADLRLPEDMHMLDDLLRDGPPDPGRRIYGRHRRKDGSIVDVEVSIAAVEFEGRPALLPMARDITERRRTEREHHASEEKLRQLQKMEAVGQLTGGVAHDFNNIITVVLANADAIADDKRAPPHIAKRAQRIVDAGQKAADLTRQLLAFSRKQLLKPEDCNLNDLVATTSQLLRRTLGEHVAVQTIAASGLWTTNVDRTQVETALINLCINARDAMPAGGRLVIETANVTLDRGYVDRQDDDDLAPGDYVQLSVSDTGTGMPAETLKRAFEPFFTTKEVGKGSGLGLSMVYGFIRQSKGHITIYSELGHGTTVKIYFRRSDPVVSTAAASARRGPLPGGSEAILVVEDEEAVREIVGDQLRSLGYSVKEAANADEALAELQRQRFDVVLTDVIMPGRLNGKGLSDEVRRLWPGTRVVFMSGYSQNALMRDGQLGRDVMLLSKPHLKADLADIIRRALTGPNGPALAGQT
jgi:PAS domain S-box-containing protein